MDSDRSFRERYPVKLAEVLDRPEHWSRHMFWTLNQGQKVEAVCLLGAIEIVCGLVPPIGRPYTRASEIRRRSPIAWDRHDRIHDVMVEVIRDLFPNTPSRHGIADFNDSRCRTFSEIHRVAAETDRRMLLQPA